MAIVNGSRVRDETAGFSLIALAGVMQDFGTGYDRIGFGNREGLFTQVRLTFTSAEVGNNIANDGGLLANQDGGLAVRVQGEDATGALTGAIGRFDDEGISFVSDGTFTFDVRDLVSGAARGDQFDIVRLGTSDADYYAEGGTSANVYINGGQGDDEIKGGLGNDFLVGGAGNDVLHGGRAGNDSFIGGGGNDVITGGAGDDTAIFNISTDGMDMVDLGKGNDKVNVSAAAGTTQIRLTFTSAEVGNNNALDANTQLNQDGGLAVRMQAENGSDGLVGLVSRYDDEGTTFTSTTPGLTFDVRDLVSGTARGDDFTTVHLGTKANDIIDFSAATTATYVNGGAGNDRIIGGDADDFLVGGAGNDRLIGGLGNDSLLGGAGADTFVFRDTSSNDSILDFVSGTDKIDLSAFGIDESAVTATTFNGSTTLFVNTSGGLFADFTITLTNGAAPVAGDYLF